MWENSIVGTCAAVLNGLDGRSKLTESSEDCASLPLAEFSSSDEARNMLGRMGANEWRSGLESACVR